jgi:hypothetical protein
MEPNGEEKLWTMEASATSALQRRGVSRGLFRVGDRVTVAGHPSTRNDAQLQLTNVLLPDGREASLWLDSAPRFADSGGAMIRNADVVVDAARENRGLFRVWTAPRPNPLTGEAISLNQPFTAAAVEARRSFDLLDNFATRCEPTGKKVRSWSRRRGSIGRTTTRSARRRAMRSKSPNASRSATTRHGSISASRYATPPLSPLQP